MQPGPNGTNALEPRALTPPSLRTHRRLGDLLVDDGLLSADQLTHVLAGRIQLDGRAERIGQAAVRLGFCTTEQIARALASQLDLEYLDTHVLTPEPGLTRLVPAALATRHQVIPLHREGDTVVVACADPTNVIALDDVRLAVGARRLRTVVAPDDVVEAALVRAYSLEVSDELVDTLTPQTDDEGNDRVDDDGDAPIVRLASEIIANAVRARASDVHIEPGPADTVVRHRIDGVLHEVTRLPRGFGNPLISRLKVTAALDIAEKRKPQDGRSRYVPVGGRQADAIDLRLSTLPTMFGESLVIRLLRRDDARPDLAHAGLDERQQAQVLGAIDRPQGLILVTGPTGSGKTTTLYSLLGHLATTERKLITVEDPIEYELGGVVQTQVNERAGYTFGGALRAMLRQDPDVVMLGEIRDPETAELALQASLTGHLVLATLHTNDATSAVVRLTELGMPEYLIASALSLVVAQRLVRQICAECRTDSPPTARHRARLSLPDQVPGMFSIGAGCGACNHTGYTGRTGVYEVLAVDGAVRELIADGASGAALQAAAHKAGLRGLREDAFAKALLGVTTLDEVLRATPTPSYDSGACPVCAQPVEPSYTNCPWCQADLAPPQCSRCDRALNPAWACCPDCGQAAHHDEEGLPRVLVVDDDVNVRSAVAAMLMGDYEVIEAVDGEAALESVHTHRPHAIVIDRHMPGMDGHQVIREIRARPAIRDTRVLLLTGDLSPAAQLEGLRAGADDWLAKPADLDVLLARLQRLLGRRVTT